MNNLDTQYLNLLQDIIDNGVFKDTRNGGVYSIFGRQIRHKMEEGFPLLTTKKMAIKSVMSELKWFLRGSTDIRELRAMGCHIWDGDCYASYERTCRWEFEESMSKEEFFQRFETDKSFANVWSYMGPIYGHQWRNWNGEGVDQIAEVLRKLNDDPDSRRIMVNAWNVSDLDYMKLPPCFSADTLILTDKSYKRIDEIDIGDTVMTEDGSFQKVYEVHTTPYSGEMLNIKVFGNTTPIKCTPNHPFLVKDKGYIQANELSTDDFLGIPINRNNIIPEIEIELKDNQYSSKNIKYILDDKDLWYFMGYFMGDGWLSHKSKSIMFVINNNEINDILPRLKNVIGLVELKNSGQNCTKYEGKIQYIYELLSMFGHKAHNKRIPQFVFDAPIDLISEFINGYFDADGCDTNDGKSYTTTSQHIAYGLQLLYAKLGIKASVYHQKRPTTHIIENRIVNQRDTYSINVYKQKNKSSKYEFTDDTLWMKVKSINCEDVSENVFNLSVDVNHTYNVYNIINHNCHYGFQLYTHKMTDSERWSEYIKSTKDEYIPYHDRMIRELDDIGFPTRKISLLWNQRSVDTPLGLPFNIASYGMLLSLLAKEVNMIADELIVNMGDVHVYVNQIKGVEEQLQRDPNKYELPELKLGDVDILHGKFDYEIIGYESYDKINFPLSN